MRPIQKIQFVIRHSVILCVLFLLTSALAFAQCDLNRYDSHGNKHGKWTEYFDVKWKTVDSAKAVYCRYTVFFHGHDVYPMFNTPWINNQLESNGKMNTTNNTVVLLDGEYTWKDKNGQTIAVYNFKNGELISMKDYAWKKLGDVWMGHFITDRIFGYRNNLTGRLHQYIDYSRKYKEGFCTYYTELYDTKGNRITGYFREGEGGWAIYDEISTNDRMAVN